MYICIQIHNTYIYIYIYMYPMRYFFLSLSFLFRSATLDALDPACGACAEVVYVGLRRLRCAATAGEEEPAMSCGVFS